MRTLAVGDIHGCYKALATLESFVNFQPEDHIITLGDHINRGPDSRSVIQWLIDHHATGHLTALRGNHECLFSAAVESRLNHENWMNFGGDKFLASYNAQSIDELPAEHLAFLQNDLQSYYQNETHFCVHANACSDLDLEKQPDTMLFWERFENVKPHKSGRIMVCGHTPQRSGYPKDIGHAICIDTAAARKGWLTCLDLDSRHCWQANEAGETRRFSLDAQKPLNAQERRAM
ncbi:MAG: metallophosphoesterase family protein [Rubripirellula sp.]|nr:metallophosphoesterase family protein [Rubripirellula sp.]